MDLTFNLTFVWILVAALAVAVLAALYLIAIGNIKIQYNHDDDGHTHPEE